MKQLISLLKHLITGNRHRDGPGKPSGRSSQTAAVPTLNEARELHRGKRRLKENYTSHWDLDYLPRADMEKILLKKSPAAKDREE